VTSSETSPTGAVLEGDVLAATMCRSPVNTASPAGER